MMRARSELGHALLAAVEQGPSIVMLTSLDGTVEYVNRKFTEVTGYTAEEVLGLPARQLGEQPSDDEDAMWAALTAGGEWRGEFHNRKKDGGDYWEQASISAVRGPDGRTTHYLKVAEDVTQRKHMERALADSEARMRRLVSANIVAVIKADIVDGRITEANDLFLQMVGYSRPELEAGRIRWDELTPAEHAGEDVAGIEVLRRTGVCPPFEKEYLHRDGTRVPVLIGAVMLEDSERECLCLIVDNTTQKRMQQELERSNADLARFASVASHDLQAPLRSIVGFLQLLERRYKGRLDADADEFIRLAVDSAHHMHALIHDLLRFATIGPERAGGRPVATDAALRQAMDNLRDSLAASSAVVSAGPLPDVLAETSQVVQIFQNLIENALKFRGAATPVVDVSARREQGHAHFLVSDNGIGIEPEQQERIFDLFTRPHGYRFQGTGMGLAICRRMVERFGGAIWVERREPSGSTFHFTLPAAT